MGLFGLFKKKEKSYPVYGGIHGYWKFYEAHEAEIKKWVDRIESVEYYENPERTVESFKRSLALFDEFREFCLQNGGEAYLKEDGFAIRDQVKKDFDSFMANEYEEYLAAWNERKADQKRIRSIKSKLLSEIKKTGSVSQVDLKKVLSGDEVRSFESVMKSLEKSGNVARSKEGSRVVFSLK